MRPDIIPTAKHPLLQDSIPYGSVTLRSAAGTRRANGYDIQPGNNGVPLGETGHALGIGLGFSTDVTVDIFYRNLLGFESRIHIDPSATTIVCVYSTAIVSLSNTNAIVQVYLGQDGLVVVD